MKKKNSSAEARNDKKEKEKKEEKEKPIATLGGVAFTYSNWR